MPSTECTFHDVCCVNRKYPLSSSRSPCVTTIFTEDPMAATVDPYDPYDPKDPVDPTGCPTCRSGFQPIDPPYEDTIDPKF